MERCVIGRTFASLAEGESYCLSCFRTYKDVSLAFPGKIETSVMFLQGSQVKAAKSAPPGGGHGCWSPSSRQSWDLVTTR